MRKLFLSFLLALAISHVGFAKSVGFTQEDRERLIRLEATLQTFMEQTNKRFEEMREDMNKRFEQMDKRFEEMREDMNKRFEQLRDEMNKRFEQVDKRFEQMMKFMELTLLVFSSLVVAVIGFAYWDRRTIIKKAKEESVEEIDRKFNLNQIRNLINALRKLAKEDDKVAKVLREFGLL